MTQPCWIPADAPADYFPDPELTPKSANGLLAAGGDLSPDRLIQAYRRGIFPWYNAGEPILWWSPDPRTVFLLPSMHISRRLERKMRNSELHFTFDKHFAAVLDQCAAPRIRQSGTWLIPEMKQAYIRLHQLGFAHSVEVWQDEHLVGGIYGVMLGNAFFGESMFSRVADASKMALIVLGCQCLLWDIRLLDCQVASPHLLSMGAHEIPRQRFSVLLAAALQRPASLTPRQLLDNRLTTASQAAHLARNLLQTRQLE